MSSEVSPVGDPKWMKVKEHWQAQKEHGFSDVCLPEDKSLNLIRDGGRQRSSENLGRRGVAGHRVSQYSPEARSSSVHSP